MSPPEFPLTQELFDKSLTEVADTVGRVEEVNPSKLSSISI